VSPPNATRRDPETRSAILRAAVELCREQGFAKLTVEGVARRAGAGKQTIYRWWPSLNAVLFEALSEVAGESSAFPDTGDIKTDLRGQMHALVQLMNSPAMAPYTGLIGAAQSDPQLAQDLYTRLIKPRITDCRARLAKAQDDGQVRKDVDLGEVVELLYAPLYYRLLLHSRPTTREQVDDILELAFAGIAAPPPRARRARTTSSPKPT
jgi:AcrR family transcriptional regulator